MSLSLSLLPRAPTQADLPVNEAVSETAPGLNICHQCSEPPTLREAICQGDNLFCSTRYAVLGIGLVFTPCLLEGTGSRHSSSPCPGQGWTASRDTLTVVIEQRMKNKQTRRSYG